MPEKPGISQRINGKNSSILILKAENAATGENGEMVKGMTRRIVEIKQTNSNYFEKAIFYCRSNIPPGTSECTLTEEAKRIIDRLCASKKTAVQPVKKKFPSGGIIKSVLSAAAGAVGAFLLFKLHCF